MKRTDDIQLKPSRVSIKVALHTEPTKKVLNIRKAKATCANAQSKFKSSHWNGIVGNLCRMRSMVDSDQESAYVPWASEKRARLLKLGEASIPSGTSVVTRKGRTMEQKKEKQECRNIARLPARVAGSALCPVAAPDVAVSKGWLSW